jgi:DNA polymerase alpha subunit A
VLNQILSDLDREEVLNNIHEYLTKIGEQIRDYAIPIEKYIINKVFPNSIIQANGLS